MFLDSSRKNNHPTGINDFVSLLIILADRNKLNLTQNPAARTTILPGSPK